MDALANIFNILTRYSTSMNSKLLPHSVRNELNSYGLFTFIKLKCSMTNILSQNYILLLE